MMRLLMARYLAPLSAKYPVALILYWVAGIYSILLIFCGFGLVGTPMLNYAGISSGAGLSLFLAWAIRKTDGTSARDLTVMVTVITAIFILPRVLQYALTPDLVEFPFPNATLTATSISGAIVYVAAGIVLFITGILLANRGRSETSLPPHPHSINIGMLLLVFIGAMIFEAFTAYIMDISIYGKLRLEHGNTLFQLLRVSIALDAAFFTCLLVLIRSRHRARKPLIALLTIAFVAYMASSGSRSVVLKVLMMAVAGILMKYRGRLMVSAKPLVAVSAFIALGFIMFPFVTQERIQISSTHWLQNGEMGETSEYNNPNTPPLSQKSPITRPLLERIKLGNLIRDVANRTGQADYAVLVLTQKPDEISLHKYMGMEYLAKSIANNLPGTPFPEAALNTSRVLDIVYRGFDENYILQHGYNAQMWTIWGLGYVLFGTTGGLAFALTCGFLLGWGYRRIDAWHHRFSPYIKAWYLYTLPPLILFTHGIDHGLNATLIVFWQFLIALLAIHWLPSKKNVSIEAAC